MFSSVWGRVGQKGTGRPVQQVWVTLCLLFYLLHYLLAKIIFYPVWKWRQFKLVLHPFIKVPWYCDNITGRHPSSIGACLLILNEENCISTCIINNPCVSLPLAPRIAMKPEGRCYILCTPDVGSKFYIANASMHTRLKPGLEFAG